jgi:hypothetical protein
MNAPKRSLNGLKPRFNARSGFCNGRGGCCRAVAQMQMLWQMMEFRGGCLQTRWRLSD